MSMGPSTNSFTTHSWNRRFCRQDINFNVENAINHELWESMRLGGGRVIDIPGTHEAKHETKDRRGVWERKESSVQRADGLVSSPPSSTEASALAETARTTFHRRYLVLKCHEGAGN